MDARRQLSASAQDRAQRHLGVAAFATTGEPAFDVLLGSAGFSECRVRADASDQVQRAAEKDDVLVRTRVDDLCASREVREIARSPNGRPLGVEFRHRNQRANVVALRFGADTERHRRRYPLGRYSTTLVADRVNSLDDAIEGAGEPSDADTSNRRPPRGLRVYSAHR